MSLDSNLRSKSGGWSQHGTLHLGSRSDSVTMQAVFDPPEPPIHAHQSLEKAVLANASKTAKNYTLEFSITPNPDANVGTHAEADIFWSVEGNFVRRTISIVNGMSVTGTAQAVRVTMRDVSVLEVAGNPPNGVPYNVSVQVAPGTRAVTNQPPLLYPIPDKFSLAPGSAMGIPVSQDAGIVSVSVDIFAGAPIAEFGVFVQHNSINAVTLKRYDPRTFQWVPIAPGTTVIFVNNPSAITVEFYVVFGIDG